MAERREDENKNYVLTGTVDDLIGILECEFDFNEKSSKLAALVLLRYNAESNDDSEKVNSYDEWYFNDELPFSTPIPFLYNGAVSVSLQNIAIDMLKCLCDITTEYMFIGSSPDITLVRDVLFLLWNNINVVPPELRCVYFNALKWKKDNKRQHFMPEDLVPDCIENVCAYLEHTIERGKKGEQGEPIWVCPYRSNEECRLVLMRNENTIEEIKRQLEKLRDSNILKEYVEGVYDFKL